MKYGYLRISTPYQSFDQQEDQLRQHGVRVFEKEIASGKRTNRPKLGAVLEELHSGDELHVSKLDRLGRTARELREIADGLQARGVSLVVNGEKHDPTTPMGRMFFGILATFAEFEADLIAERTRERLQTLRAQGKQVGKPKKLSERQAIAAYHAVSSGHRTLTAVADRYGVSRTTVRRAVDEQRLSHDLKINAELRREARLLALDERQVDRELDRAQEAAA